MVLYVLSKTELNGTNDWGEDGVEWKNLACVLMRSLVFLSRLPLSFWPLLPTFVSRSRKHSNIVHNFRAINVGDLSKSHLNERSQFTFDFVITRTLCKVSTSYSVLTGSDKNMLRRKDMLTA